MAARQIEAVRECMAIKSDKEQKVKSSSKGIKPACSRPLAYQEGVPQRLHQSQPSQVSGFKPLVMNLKEAINFSLILSL